METILVADVLPPPPTKTPVAAVEVVAAAAVVVAVVPLQQPQLDCLPTGDRFLGQAARGRGWRKELIRRSYLPCGKPDNTG